MCFLQPRTRFDCSCFQKIVLTSICPSCTHSAGSHSSCPLPPPCTTPTFPLPLLFTTPICPPPPRCTSLTYHLPHPSTHPTFRPPLPCTILNCLHPHPTTSSGRCAVQRSQVLAWVFQLSTEAVFLCKRQMHSCVSIADGSLHTKSCCGIRKSALYVQDATHVVYHSQCLVMQMYAVLGYVVFP